MLISKYQIKWTVRIEAVNAPLSFLMHKGVNPPIHTTQYSKLNLSQKIKDTHTFRTQKTTNRDKQMLYYCPSTLVNPQRENNRDLLCYLEQQFTTS